MLRGNKYQEAHKWARLLYLYNLRSINNVRVVNDGETDGAAVNPLDPSSADAAVPITNAQVQKWESEVNNKLAERMEKLNSFLMSSKGEEKAEKEDPLVFKVLEMHYVPIIIQVDDYENSVKLHRDNIHFLNNDENSLSDSGSQQNAGENPPADSNALRPITSYDCSENVRFSNGGGANGGKKKNKKDKKGFWGGKKGPQKEEDVNGSTDASTPVNQSESKDTDISDGDNDFQVPFAHSKNSNSPDNKSGRNDKKKKGLFSMFGGSKDKQQQQQRNTTSPDSGEVELSARTTPRITAALCIYQLHRASLFNSYMKMIDTEDHGVKRLLAKSQGKELNFRHKGTLKGGNFYHFYLSQSVPETGDGKLRDDWGCWYYHDYETFLGLPIFANVTIDTTDDGKKKVDPSANQSSNAANSFRITNATVLEIEDNKEAIRKALDETKNHEGGEGGGATPTAAVNRIVHITCRFMLEGIRQVAVRSSTGSTGAGGESSETVSLQGIVPCLALRLCVEVPTAHGTGADTNWDVDFIVEYLTSLVELKINQATTADGPSTENASNRRRSSTAANPDFEKSIPQFPVEKLSLFISETAKEVLSYAA